MKNNLLEKRGTTTSKQMMSAALWGFDMSERKPENTKKNVDVYLDCSYVVVVEVLTASM